MRAWHFLQRKFRDRRKNSHCCDVTGITTSTHRCHLEGRSTRHRQLPFLGSSETETKRLTSQVRWLVDECYELHQ
jgi:hypothetical protein